MSLGKLTVLCVLIIQSAAVPPEECFAKFNYGDCGREPVHVMTYWKPGSRCDSATWRGCLPNPNMFADEYECVKTCIYNKKSVKLPLLLEDSLEKLMSPADPAEVTESGLNKTDLSSAEVTVATENSPEIDKSLTTESVTSNKTLLSDKPDTSNKVTSKGDSVSPKNVSQKPIDASDKNATLAPNKVLSDPKKSDSGGPLSPSTTKGPGGPLPSSTTMVPGEPQSSSSTMVPAEPSSSSTTTAPAEPEPMSSSTTMAPAEPSDITTASTKTAVQEDEGNQQEKIDTQPEEVNAEKDEGGLPAGDDKPESSDVATPAANPE